MKRKGFTLVELLVVIAIIALLMGILMPALARVRQLAFRMTCGTNLSGIGKACLLYANDYDDEMPKAGARSNTWGTLADWTGQWSGNREIAYSTQGGSDGTVTITSNFFLLVKYAEVTPKQFLCKGESDTVEFELRPEYGAPSNRDLTDAFDFGPTNSPNDEPWKSCSYAYHHPFGQYSLTTTHEPTMAVAADRNPWTLTLAERDEGDTFTAFIPDEGDLGGTKETAERGNSEAHQSEGQNVLFLDSHVSFEKRSYVGTEQDNIYTPDSATRPDNSTAQYYTGLQPPALYNANAWQPGHRKDSVLLNDGPTGGGGGGGGGGGR